MTQSRERIVERVTAALTGDPAPIAIHHARKIDARGVADHFWIVSDGGVIVATGTDLVKTTYRLARAMKKKDTQFITVISGCDVSDEDAEKTTDLVRAKCGSSVEVSHISGGQPGYYYMISVE